MYEEQEEQPGEARPEVPPEEVQNETLTVCIIASPSTTRLVLCIYGRVSNHKYCVDIRNATVQG